MSGQLATELDYIHFVYGLSQFLLACICLVLHRRSVSDVKWSWLAMFGLANGLHQWGDLLTLAVGQSSLFNLVPLVLYFVAHLFLTEFGRTSWILSNGRCIGQWVLLPMQAEEMAKQGLAIMLNDMLEVRRRLNRQLQVLGVVLTLYNERHKVDRQILAEMEAAVSGAGQYFFHTVIPERQELVQASGARKAVRVFRPDGTAARAYDALALEIMQRVGDPAGQDVAPQKETEVQDE